MIGRSEQGFTLVEIGVIVPIIMVVALTLFSVMFSYLLSSDREKVRLYEVYGQSTSLDRMETDVRLSTGFLTDRSPATPDPYVTVDNTSYRGSDEDHRVLLLEEYATVNNPLSNIRTPVYEMTSTAPDCTLPSSIKGPLTYTVAYFIQDKTLYKRTLTNTSARTCEQQYQKLSCPVASSLGTGTRNASCKADDEVVLSGVASFRLRYFDGQSSDDPLDAYGTPTQVGVARSVEVTIVSSQASYNGNVESTSTLRLLRQNDRVRSGS